MLTAADHRYGTFAYLLYTFILDVCISLCLVKHLSDV